MNESEIKNQAQNDDQSQVDEASCLEVIDTAVSYEQGILNVSVDTTSQQVMFDYDPAQIGETDLIGVAEGLAPTLNERWRTCTMRLGKHGGRACESCALSLERRLGQVPGVRRATASYLGGVLSVTYDEAVLSRDDISHQVEAMGIPVLPSASVVIAQPEERSEQPLTGLAIVDAWLQTQNIEAIFTAITFVTMMAGLIAERMGAGTAVVAAFYGTAYITGGFYGFKAGLESLRDRTIDVDLLMILAALGAAIVGQPFEGAMLLFLFSLSNVLQDYALNRTRNAISSLMEMRPAQALIRRGDKNVMLPIERINVGDRMIVKPGERLALDGVIIEGESSIDQSTITGESIPVHKKAGDTVFAGTINKNGSLEVGITKLAKDSTIARLIMMVEEAQSEKAETQRFIDEAEQYYAIGVIVLTFLAMVIPPLFLGEAFADSFYRAMTILVAASPCAIVISTPATVLSAIGNGARRGVLFKGGVYVENMATIKAIAFDKTGTLTKGKPQVTDVVLTDYGRDAWGGSRDDLLALTAAAESRSEHALAQAAVLAANDRQLQLAESMAFQAETGMGVQALVGEKQVRVGNLRYFEEMNCVGLEMAAAEVDRLQNEGKTSVAVAQIENETAHILGVVAFADVMRSDAAEIVQKLKDRGIEHVIMLTGDNRQVADRVADKIGIDDVYADLLPEDKVNAIKDAQQRFGPVAMVGDGVNDAPALATADIGIAMGAAGTDVALETADVVLMSDNLNNIPYVIELSHATRRTLTVNLVFAIGMILLMLLAIFKVDLPLPAAVVGHEGGTVLVSLNGMRLLRFKPKE